MHSKKHFAEFALFNTTQNRETGEVSSLNHVSWHTFTSQNDENRIT